MIVKQALFGEHKGGHALLTSTNPPDSRMNRLLDRTDLQGSVPPGVEWQSYLSGFPFESSYVLMRTYPDGTASRGGMVVTHALLIDANDISSIEDIEELSRHLPMSTPNRSSEPLPNIHLSTCESSGRAQADNAADVELLTALQSQGKRPVVWAGQEGFEQAIGFVWHLLWPEMRSRFSFKLAFSPQDAYLPQFAVVCTPENTLSRWTNYSVVARGSQHHEVSSLPNLLSDRETSQRLRELAYSLPYSVQEFADLQLLETLDGYLKKEDATFDELLAAMRLMAAMSPSPEHACTEKRRVLEQVARLLPLSTLADLRRMRNLDTSHVQEASLLWTTFSEQVYRLLQRGSGNTAVPLVVRDVLSNRKSMWSLAMTRGLALYLNGGSLDVASTLWTCWGADNHAISFMLELVTDKSGLEDDVIASAPKHLDRNLATVLAEQFYARHWYSASAYVLNLGWGMQHALREQLALERTPGVTAAVDMLFSLSTAEDLLAVALATGNEIVANRAGERLAGSPDVFGRADCTNPVWMAMFIAALQASPEQLSRTQEANALAYALLKAAASGRALDLGTWQGLAKTRWADISQHEDRAQLWDRIPPIAISQFLSRTAVSWISQFKRDFPPPEVPLSRAIKGRSEFTHLLDTMARQDILTGLHLFRIVPDSDDAEFDRWLVTVLSNNSWIEEGTVQQIVTLIETRNWSRAAERLVRDASVYKRSDLQPVVDRLSTMLSFWRRISWPFSYGKKQAKEYLDENPSRAWLPKDQWRDQLVDPAVEIGAVIVFTALEVEFNAVMKYVSSPSTVRHPEGTLYEEGKFLSPEGAWRVVVAQTGAGNTVAASETERAISHFKPSHVMFVGVAGGLKDVVLGDVVAATKVYGYESGKDENEFKTRPDVGHSAYEMVQVARKVARDRKWQERLELGGGSVPNAIVAPIAAGDKVVASHDAISYQLLRRAYGDAVAVEMEGIGFMRAAYANSRVKTLLVRGVSDLIEAKADADASGSQTTAASNAAAFAFEILAQIAVLTRTQR